MLKGIKRRLSDLIKGNEGYGTVEMLVIVAGLGSLALGVGTSLHSAITGVGGPVDSVKTELNNSITSW